MASDIIRKIEDLIEGIDEFNEKYVTYNAKVLRIVLVETIDYIKQKDRALDTIERYVRDNSDFDKSDKLTSNTGAYDILEIINKSKVGNNDR